jgi:hypothetical protein
MKNRLAVIVTGVIEGAGEVCGGLVRDDWPSDRLRNLRGAKLKVK